MAERVHRPIDVARRLASRRDRLAQQGDAPMGSSTWRRETFVLPRLEARETAREWLSRFPKAAYMSEVESWRELADGRIEFTMRRLPTAD